MDSVFGGLVRSALGNQEGSFVSDDRERAPRLPPRWFIRLVWSAHRAVCRIAGGRLGLWRPKRGRWGTARLTTTGRRTGQQRSVIVGYVEDGPNLVTLAMNGWADPEPAWWLNLQAHPDATVDLVVRHCGGDPKTQVRALLTTEVPRGPRPASRMAGRRPWSSISQVIVAVRVVANLHQLG